MVVPCWFFLCCICFLASFWENSFFFLKITSQSSLRQWRYGTWNAQNSITQRLCVHGELTRHIFHFDSDFMSQDEWVDHFELKFYADLIWWWWWWKLYSKENFSNNRVVHHYCHCINLVVLTNSIQSMWREMIILLKTSEQSMTDITT